MNKTDESRRCKWTISATDLLVSIWSHDLVQKQLKNSTRNQPIWESVARYMTKKGHSVTGLQCRTRIKNMLSIYQEKVRKNESTDSEPYHKIFKRILFHKKIKKDRDLSDNSSTKTNHLNSSNEEVREEVETFIPDQDNQDPVTDDNEYEEEYLDRSNSGSPKIFAFNDEDMKTFANLMLYAVEKQTQAITQAITSQSQFIENILIAETRKLQMILNAERENRCQLETKFEKLLDKINVSLVTGNMQGTSH